MSAYYNENDDYAARWLRNLIKAGHIADGVVDTRSIADVHPDDLRGFTQCHFFAGIGVWSRALRLAGWPDDRPVWTGSCPCQPFSAAGKGAGFADERHLWPHWQWLISKRRPVQILGEQVASPDGRDWLDLVHDDLEGDAFEVGACVTPAASAGAPHGRHRIWFMAHPRRSRRDQARAGIAGNEGAAQPERDDAAGRGRAGALAHPDGAGAERLGEHGGQAAGAQRIQRGPAPGGVLDHAIGDRGRARRDDDAGRVDHPAEQGLEIGCHDQEPGRAVGHEGCAIGGSGAVRGFWADAEWVLCRDPKGPRWRPIEPGSFPLADGAHARVGRLRAYGNAINAEQAAQFIRAAMMCRDSSEVTQTVTPRSTRKGTK